MQKKKVMFNLIEKTGATAARADEGKIEILSGGDFISRHLHMGKGPCIILRMG
jgi:hypothetical protein